MLLTKITVVASSVALLAMAFTPSELTAITIASGALIATIFTGVVNIITALRLERKSDKHNEASDSRTERVIEKVDAVHAKAEVIEGHVNSAATAATSKIDAMQKQIDQLTRLLAEGKQTAAVLAQSKADVAVLAPIAATVELKSKE